MGGRVCPPGGRAPAHATATITPSTGADGASPPVRSSTLGSHIAAGRTDATRQPRIAPRKPRDAGDRDRPDQPEPDHCPSPRAEVGEPVAQLGEIRRTGVAAGLDRLSRHVVGNRDVQALEHGGRDVGGADQPLRAGRVGIQRRPPAQPGRPGRHQTPGDVARVLDHQHQVAAGDAPRGTRGAVRCPGGPGGSFTTKTLASRHRTARGARYRPGAHERDALDTTGPVGRDGRLPVAGSPRARISDMPAGLADGRCKQARDDVRRGGAGPLGDRLPRGHAARPAQVSGR